MAEKHKDAPWQTISEYVVGTIIKHEGLVVAVMHGEDKIPKAERIVKCLNALEGIENPETFVNIGKGSREEIQMIRSYLKADENESTFDEVVRKFEKELKISSIIYDDLQAKIKENDLLKLENTNLKSENANLKAKLSRFRENITKAKSEIRQIITEAFS